MFGMASLVFGMVQSAGTETSDFLAAIDLIKPQSKICVHCFLLVFLSLHGSVDHSGKWKLLST